MSKAYFGLFAIMLFLSSPIAASQTLTFSAIQGEAIIPEAKRILTEAYSRLGYQINIRELPAERALLFSNSGKTDGELFRIKNIHTRYPNLVMVPISIVTGEDVVFARKGIDMRVDGFQSLNGYKIGIVRGIINAREVTKGMDVHVVSKYEQLFELLEKGRIDVIFLNRQKGLRYINQLKYKNIIMLEPPLSKLKLYHYLNVRHEDLISNLSNTLKQMKEEGFF
ncbi:transporter substrate-binding domain-containing protein [Vibrio sp. S4M6]|uniref:substrate-binding periplasmic protein n=1 Tax=Vibrio sinus TaxID=2946865 RepID=UPI002029CB9B|nr:transporter substrate-binding domain-containing protein [Vibrio sinus]MCL9779934.1 transporter substrate-binding domain-containing protein [Vibrio sinus]